MKNSERQKAVNKFRFASMLQKRITIKQSQANLFEDYQTTRLLYSTKNTIKTMESNLLLGQQIVADYKLKTRYADDISDSDRLIFFGNKNRLSHSNLIRVSSIKDNSGRKEYSEILGSSGVYAGPAGKQPEDNNRIVYKGLIPTTDHDEGNIESFLNNNYDTDLKLSLFNSIDAWIINRPDNNYYIENKTQSSKNPLIISYNDFLSLVAKDIESNQTINFQKQKIGERFVYTADYQIAINSRKLLQFKFTE